MKKLMQIRVDKGFDLEKAVCNHGFFMMLPNQWIPSNKSLRRPLRLADGSSSVMVSISSQLSSSELNHSHIVICVENPTLLCDSDKVVIQKQVVRMLRLTKKDENDVREFQEVHADARSKGFGRLFRSSSLFEDFIKSILLCHTSWNRTLEMCQNLCELQAELHLGMHKDVHLDQDCTSAGEVRPRNINGIFRGCKKPTSKVYLEALGNFPSATELAGLSEKFLRERCNLGFRAHYVIQLAKLVKGGKLKLGELEGAFDDTSYDKIRKKLMKLKGIGPFAAANILMCVGDYRIIPSDSETIQHLHEVHGINTSKTSMEKDARQVYDKFAPNQCLAYWYERVESYERKLGQKLSKLSMSNYHKVASCYLSSKAKKEKDSVTMTRKRKRTCSQA